MVNLRSFLFYMFDAIKFPSNHFFSQISQIFVIIKCVFVFIKFKIFLKLKIFLFHGLFTSVLCNFQMNLGIFHICFHY
jgi:hypothetical protein